MAPQDEPGTAAVPDETLVARVLEGDEKSFGILYDRYFTRVYRFVDRRLRNRADTEDTVQEIFTNLVSSLASFRGEAPFGAWVFGLARRTVAGRFKRKQLELVPLPEDDEPGGASLQATARQTPDPLQSYECRERLDRMRSAVERDLSPTQWKLFQLHHLENRSIQDVAQLVCKSEDAVKSHLYRARKLLLAR